VPIPKVRWRRLGAERLDEVVHGVADALLDLWVFGPDGVQLQGYRPNELSAADPPGRSKASGDSLRKCP